tara:strand:+ start:361 stop:729 length:369 start_codon:yes stop_codon:yes gene_type:complete
MSSLGVALPLTLDSGDGFTMLKDFKDTIRQNLKMLILTNPGERIMEPNFGVGMRRYLFENYGEDVTSRIETKIKEQVILYMPSISIRSVQFDTSNIDSNNLGVTIKYEVPQIAVRDLLQFTI